MCFLRVLCGVQELREKLAEATSCRNLILRVGKKSLKDFKLEIGFLFEKITLNFC